MVDKEDRKYYSPVVRYYLVSRDISNIKTYEQINPSKAIIYDEENGEKEITTADLGIASYLCDDTDPVKAPVITKIRNLEECLNYFWFDKIAEKELAATNKTEYIRQQMEIQFWFFIQQTSGFFKLHC